MQLGHGRYDDALPGSLLRNHAAFCGMTALPRQVRIPLYADKLSRPFERIRGVFAHEFNVFRISEPQTYTFHIRHQSFRRIFDSLLFLNAGSRNRNHAAGQRRVAADKSHLFKDSDGRSGFPCR